MEDQQAPDLVKRLRGTFCSCDVPFHEHTCPMRQAADRIVELEAEVERLRRIIQADDDAIDADLNSARWNQ